MLNTKEHFVHGFYSNRPKKKRSAREKEKHIVATLMLRH